MNTHLALTGIGAIMGGYFVWNLGMYLAALLRAMKWRDRLRLSAGLQPQIRQELIAFLAGSENHDAIKEFIRKSRRDVADALLSFQPTVAGSARDRLCALTIEHELIHDWCNDTRSKDSIIRRTAFARLAFVCAYEPCRRVAGELLRQALNDADREVRFYAWRALVQSGTIEEIEKLFEAALSESLLIRILLTEELRRFAISLCERAVVWALQSPESKRVLATLEILVAWERAVPIPDLGVLLSHGDRRIRIEALRLATLVPLERQDLRGIARMAVSDDPEAAVEAARTLGRVRFEGGLPELASAMRSGNALLARTAADAMAEIQGKGWATLEELSAGGDRMVAAAAAEALDRVHRKTRV